MAVAEPLLLQLGAQHRFQRVRWAAAPGLGVRRFVPIQQRRPWRHLFHLSQKLFALGALALAGVFGVAKGHLRHRWVSRWLLRYSTKIDLFRASLDHTRPATHLDVLISGCSTREREFINGLNAISIFFVKPIQCRRPIAIETPSCRENLGQ